MSELHAQPLSVLLREATRELHRDAERGGVMGRLLRRAATRQEYTAMLVALREIYGALEDGLRRHADRPGMAALLPPGLARVAALEADLRELAAMGERIPPAHPEALRYAQHLRELSAETPTRLLAHAWLRYLGDLNGGQVVARLVRAGLDLPDRCLSFYRFAFDAPVETVAAAWKAALDAIVLTDPERRAMVDEARDGFRRHIALFTALDAQDASTPSSAA